MAEHMRANSARKDGLDRMSLACVWANCWRRERKTESWVAREVEWELRRVFPWEAYCSFVIFERSNAASPIPLFLDIIRVCYCRCCIPGGCVEGSEVVVVFEVEVDYKGPASGLAWWPVLRTNRRLAGNASKFQTSYAQLIHFDNS